ncbi:MAG: zinc ribbon domain-containing protein [Longimicrobiales bacterium]
MDDLVERMHAVLASALRQGRPDPFGAPVTVAEIYQDLVPYRTVRAQLGFDMNADYEHTLLRLLAGEAELARLDPPEAREELRSELDSPNPNVGLFRKFAACDVWITPGGSTDAPPRPEPGQSAHPAPDTWDPRGLSWEQEDPELAAALATPDAPIPSASAPPQAGWTEEQAETELLLEDAVELPIEEEEPVVLFPGEAPAAAPATEAFHGGEMTVDASPATVDRPGAPAAAGAANCAFCDSALPAGRVVRFCAYCGADQATVPCAACGEAVEQGWNYCVACGAHTPPVPPS